jgi:hypothetical protein
MLNGLKRREKKLNRIFPCLLLLLFFYSACHAKLSTVPTGTWKYRLVVNGADIGKAVVTNAVVAGNYVTAVGMEIDAGYVKNTSRQIITETLDFKPVKLEVYNKTTQNGKVSEVKTIAKFNDGRVELDTGESRTTFTIEKPFVLEGNYFMQELIKAGFKPGAVIENYVYEPSVDIEAPILILVKVIGKEDVTINGKTKNLLHLGYSIENLKNIDAYIDDNGVTHKTIIVMLNNKMEMLLE